eukprot:SM000237S08132  [mRNA]  locus=s237:41483:42243:+ [translate_table: standard]
MIAVFLGSPRAGQDGISSGTGVFIPGGAVATAARKPSCSTVLVPARVLEALNLDIKNNQVTQPAVPAVVRQPTKPRHSERKSMYTCRPGSGMQPMTPRPAVGDSFSYSPAIVRVPSLELPVEWTY